MFSFIQGISNYLSDSASLDSNALAQIRNSPDTFFAENYIVVNPKARQDQPEGGSCSIQCYREDDHVYRLDVVAGSDDYYYPVMQETFGGIGHCSVPKNAPPGTIVLTGGFNGCGAEIWRNDDNFTFIHNYNCKFNDQVGERNYGDRLVNITPLEYWNDADASNITATTKGLPVVFIVAIRGTWHWKVNICTIAEEKRPNLPRKIHRVGNIGSGPKSYKIYDDGHVEKRY